MTTSQQNSVFAFLWKFLAGIAVFSAIAGFFVYRNYLVFEQEMLKAKATLESEGPGLDLSGCVDRVIYEVEHCTKMKVLCEQAVPRLMGACLTGRDRQSECKDYSENMGSTRFGYSQCVERGRVGRRNKACGNAFKAFGDYCKDNYLRKS